jgi:hypothetical protein
VLTRRLVLPGRRMLQRHTMPGGPDALAVVQGPDADAVADPYRTGAKHAPQFTRARQVDALTGAQREVLVITRQVAIQVAPAGCVPPAACFSAGTGIRASREPVVRIWPLGGLVGILTRGADALGEIRQLVAAALPYRSERH